MKAILVRTGSVPVLSSFIPGSPRVSLSVHDSVTGEKSNVTSPRISLHLEVNRRSIRRALSESDLIRPETEVSGSFMRSSVLGSRSRSFPARIPEEEYVSESDEVAVGGIESMITTERGFDRSNNAGDWPVNEIPVEEFEFYGGGIGRGKMAGGGRGGDDFGTGDFVDGNFDRRKIGAYYQEMLKSNPTNSLLLRNYGKFLHEVEKDAIKAEEYYGRAILESPGDGELLSLYGKLIWETNRDEDRARSYLDQAVHASPDDCMVLGSYAHFMWEAEEEDIEVPSAMVEAF